jgi:hypothetical protein
MPTFYLGYSTLTEWRAAIDANQPVNALSIIEPGRASVRSGGLQFNKQVIVLSQQQGGTVHYLRLVTDGYQSINGLSAVHEMRLHEQRAESAWVIVQAWLAEQGLTFRRAILAFPKTLRLLDGSAGTLMEFSRELDRWIYADRIDPAWLVPTPAAQPQGA